MLENGPSLFVKKPVEITAWQMPFFPTSSEAMDLYQWIESSLGSLPAPELDGPDHVRVSGVTISSDSGLMVIRTLEGDMSVSLGDWVIRGVEGEFYPCKPDIFKKNLRACNNVLKLRSYIRYC